MKKLLLLVLLLQFSFSIFAQSANNYEGLIDASRLISRCGIINSLTFLANRTGSGTIISAKKSGELIDNYITIYTEGDNKQEGKLLKMYREKIVSYIEDIDSFGATGGALAYDDEERFTSGFCQYNNQLVFVQTGIYSDYNYNTIRLDATARAFKALRDISLPSLYNFRPLENIDEIKYYMIIVGYTAKDFTSESIADADAETVAFLVPKAGLTKYLNAEITDDELIKLSVIYNINKTTNNNIKRLSL